MIFAIFLVYALQLNILSHRHEIKKKFQAQCIGCDIYVHIELNLILMVVTLVLIVIKIFLFVMSNENSVILKQNYI